MQHLFCEVNDTFKIQDEYRFGASFQALRDMSFYRPVDDEFRQMIQRLASTEPPPAAQQYFEERFRVLAANGPDNLNAYKKYAEKDPQELWDSFWTKPKPGFAGKVRWLLTDGRMERRYNTPANHKAFFSILRLVRQTVEHKTLLILAEY